MGQEAAAAALQDASVRYPQVQAVAASYCYGDPACGEQSKQHSFPSISSTTFDLCVSISLPLSLPPTLPSPPPPPPPPPPSSSSSSRSESSLWTWSDRCTSVQRQQQLFLWLHGPHDGSSPHSGRVRVCPSSRYVSHTCVCMSSPPLFIPPVQGLRRWTMAYQKTSVIVCPQYPNISRVSTVWEHHLGPSINMLMRLPPMLSR